MLANTFVDSAKVMAKGQITIPKDVRNVLGVSNGDRVTFIIEGNTVGSCYKLNLAPNWASLLLHGLDQFSRQAL